VFLFTFLVILLMDIDIIDRFNTRFKMKAFVSIGVHAGERNARALFPFSCMLSDQNKVFVLKGCLQ